MKYPIASFSPLRFNSLSVPVRLLGLVTLLSGSVLAGCSSVEDGPAQDGQTPSRGSGGLGPSDPSSGDGASSGGAFGSGNGGSSTIGSGAGGTPLEPHPSLEELLPESVFHAIYPITDPSSPLAEDFSICPAACRSATIYEGLIDAAAYFPDFASVGTEEQRLREVAAFLANVAKETTGGWDDAPGGKEAWGLCYCEELNGSGYTQSSDPNYQAAPGQSYHGRGSIQLSYPFNYGPFSEFMFGDKYVLLDDPSRVATEPLLFWASGLYFWMNETVAPDYELPHGDPSGGGLDGIYYKPSCHMAMNESWIPRASDVEKNRTFGFGVTINVINGGLECNWSWDARGMNRVAFYDEFAALLSVDAVPAGRTADDYSSCQTQTAFGTP